MIQRIQSIYLTLTSLVLLGGLFFYPHRLFYNAEEINVFQHPLLSFMLALMALGPLAVVFMYKKRQLQFVLNRLLILILFLFLTLHLIGYVKIETATANQVVPLISYLIAVILLVLANKAIKRDEDLVRAADRIR
ncbi:MAG: DUF4293 family protein [Flavobacteriaceae bacterium]